MGVTYSSYLRVVVDMKEADIIKTVTEITTLCDHEHTSKFCPKCGTPASKRTEAVIRKQFTKPFAHLTECLDIEEYATDDDEGPDEDVYEEPNLHYLIYEMSGRVELGAGLRLVYLVVDEETAGEESSPLALVANISEVDVYGTGMAELTPNSIPEALRTVKAALARAGINKTPRVVHMMHC